MLDERWRDDVAEVTATLRSILADRADEAVVRAAEASHGGWSPDVDAHLREFGLYELPPDPELLAAIAWELGRSLAPVPWPEVAAVGVALGEPDAGFALDGLAPVGVGRAVVRVGDGAGIVAVAGSGERTGGGDRLVRVDGSGAAARWSPTDVDRLTATVRLLGAARLMGAARRLLEIGVDYAKERHAFGKPIGSYQAVSHQLADAAVAVEGGELLVKKTAFLASDDPTSGGCPSAFFAAMAWATAVESSRLVARNVHQCMAGFGATLEYPAQLYSRRIRSWALRCGRPADVYREVAETVLDPERREAIVGLWHHDRGIAIPRWARELDRLG